MKRALLSGILALVLAAPASSAPEIAAKSYSDRVSRLTEVQRLAVMRRAILDAGEACQRPVEASLSGTYKNLIMWTARCAPAGEYGVFIGPNALVQVRRCDQAAELKLPPCASPPRAAAAPARR